MTPVLHVYDPLTTHFVSTASESNNRFKELARRDQVQSHCTGMSSDIQAKRRYAKMFASGSNRLGEHIKICRELADAWISIRK